MQREAIFRFFLGREVAWAVKVTKKLPRPLKTIPLSEAEEGIYFPSPENPSVGLCNSSYCHSQLLIRRCRIEQGPLPRGAELEGSLSAQLATKTHTYQISTSGVILTAYKIHTIKCVLVDFLEFPWFPWDVDHRRLSCAPQLKRTFSSEGHPTEHKSKIPTASPVSSQETSTLVMTLGWTE